MAKVKIDYTGWKFYRDLIEPYGEHLRDYYAYRYKGSFVYTDEIVGLSFKGVLSQEKLDRLYHSIKEHGYFFDRYSDLHLVYLPNKTYTVASGGNHRPYLAKLLGISRIKAYTEILIPKSILTAEQIERCDKIIEEEGLDLNTRNPYFYDLCKQYDLLPPKIKVRIT